MTYLRIVVPAIVTIILTILAIISTLWLTSLVPAGDWANFIKAMIVVFVIGSTLLIIAWSAYFAYIIRQYFKS